MFKSPAVRVAAFASACLLSTLSAVAQSAAPSTQAPADPNNPQLAIRTNGKSTTAVPTTSQNQPDAQKYIAREFGPGFKIAPNMPVLLGDLDGDGLEDAVFIVTGGNPIVSAGAFGFTLLDPYDGYWSFSDPMVNAHLSHIDQGPHYYVLVSHDWRGEKAKAKYVFMNLPFKEISLTPTTMGSGRFSNKKNRKVVAALTTVEGDGQTGAVYWDGKTYKFVQLGNTED